MSDDSDLDSDDAASLSDDESATSVSDEQPDDEETEISSVDDDEASAELSNTDYRPRPEDIAVVRKDLAKLKQRTADTPMTAREMITLSALSSVLKSGLPKSEKRAAAHLVHLAVLSACKLSERSLPNSNSGLDRHGAFLQRLSYAASCALSGWFEEDQGADIWDAFDLLDGRLFLQVATGLDHADIPEDVHQTIRNLANLLKDISGVDITAELPSLISTQRGTSRNKVEAQPRTARPVFSVLPFSHPVLDPYLQPVKVQTAELPEPRPAPKIFQELTHWHNAKKPLDPKFIPKPPGFFARKRNQKFMADTIAYSASLTGSSGKNIDPEIIVSGNQTVERKPKAATSSEQDWKAALKEKAAAKSKVPVLKNKKAPVKSGKQKALEAAGALKAEKTQEKSVAVIAFWAKRCVEFEKEPSLTRRYAKAQKYLLDISTAHEESIGSEVSLYLCHVLTLLRASTDVSQKSGKLP